MKLDIKSILTVIRRRKNPLKNKEPSHLSLQTTCFQATHLMNAHLEGADLRNTHFEGAFLGYAHISGAHFEGVDLSNASLKEAKNLIINQLYDVKTLYNAELDESLRSLLIEKYPTLFDEP